LLLRVKAKSLKERVKHEKFGFVFLQATR